MSSPVNSRTVPVFAANADENNVHMEPASSSRPPSVAGSDGSNTAAGSVSSDEDITEPTIVPYTGHMGSTYTQDTPPQDFSDWPVYLTFCEDGPTLSLQCINTVTDDGTPSSFTSMDVSKKLFLDHSLYFQGMFRSGCKETGNDKVEYVDILQEELMRLKMIMVSGTPTGRVNIGNEEHEMSNLVRTYELADRFRMPEIKGWIEARGADFINSHRNWKAAYQHEVVNAPAVSTLTTAKENFHREKLLDICKAHSMLLELGPDGRLIRPDQIVDLIAKQCPPMLLCSMVPRIDQTLAIAIFIVNLTNM